MRQGPRRTKSTPCGLGTSGFVLYEFFDSRLGSKKMEFLKCFRSLGTAMASVIQELLCDISSWTIKNTTLSRFLIGTALNMPVFNRFFTPSAKNGDRYPVNRLVLILLKLPKKSVPLIQKVEGVYANKGHKIIFTI